VKYRYAATPSFRKALRKLNPSQKQSAKKAYAIFKTDPFDPRLRTHKIHGLSARLGRTIYSVRIEGDLRALFYLAKDLVVSLDIGDHRIYRDE
jgi:mRNA-degrading endonuclease RelE of RelBE toxin-antitoxin system